MKIAVARAGCAGLFVALPLNLWIDGLTDGADRVCTHDPFCRD